MNTALASPEPEPDPMDQPGYWMEVVRQESLAKHDCRSIESLQPQKAAMALEMLARCDSIRKISRATGLSTSTIQQMKWRHAETLETRKKKLARVYGIGAETAMNLTFQKLEMLEDDEDALAQTSLKDIALTTAILTDKAMALSGMATVTIEHRKGPSIEDAQAAITAARAKIAERSRTTAIDV